MPADVDRIEAVERLARSANSNAEHALIKIEAQEKLYDERVRSMWREMTNIKDSVDEVDLKVREANTIADTNWREARRFTWRLAIGVMTLQFIMLGGLLLVIWETVIKPVVN